MITAKVTITITIESENMDEAYNDTRAQLDRWLEDEAIKEIKVEQLDGTPVCAECGYDLVQKGERLICPNCSAAARYAEEMIWGDSGE